MNGATYDAIRLKLFLFSLRNSVKQWLNSLPRGSITTWKRFKDLLRRCPHQGLPTWLQVQTFYNGLNHVTEQMIDVAVRGIGEA